MEESGNTKNLPTSTRRKHIGSVHEDSRNARKKKDLGMYHDSAAVFYSLFRQGTNSNDNPTEFLPMQLKEKV